MHICVIKKYVYIRSMKYDCLACLSSSLPKGLPSNLLFHNSWLAKMHTCIHLNIYTGSYNSYFCIHVLIHGNVRFSVSLSYSLAELVNLKSEKICYILKDSYNHYWTFTDNSLNSDMHRCNDLHAVYNLSLCSAISA